MKVENEMHSRTFSAWKDPDQFIIAVLEDFFLTLENVHLGCAIWNYGLFSLLPSVIE